MYAHIKETPSIGYIRPTERTLVNYCGSGVADIHRFSKFRVSGTRYDKLTIVTVLCYPTINLQHELRR